MRIRLHIPQSLGQLPMITVRDVTGKIVYAATHANFFADSELPDFGIANVDPRVGVLSYDNAVPQLCALDTFGCVIWTALGNWAWGDAIIAMIAKLSFLMQARQQPDALMNSSMAVVSAAPIVANPVIANPVIANPT